MCVYICSPRLTFDHHESYIPSQPYYGFHDNKPNIMIHDE